MPDIIEENEGEGGSVVARRANALVLARAAAAAARAQANNNNNANAVAVPEGNNNNNNNALAPAGAETAAEVTQVATHLARLAGVDVRPMFRRLGVRRCLDIRYIREKDLDGLPRITPIQKRKMWAVLKYVATDNPPLTARTTLSEIAKTLNANKKKEKENTSTGSSTALTAIATSAIVPLVQVSKLEAFDGAHSKWVVWKNQSRYALAQTNLGALILQGDQGATHAKKHPGHDHLLFNLLAEAIVCGSAKHLIHKAEEHPVALAAAAASANQNNRKASGRALWQLLREEYSTGPMAFWIVSDARQTLQRLQLVGSSSAQSDKFLTSSAHDYVNRFRFARETLAEYKQVLPDSFLASTFVEHIQDEKLDKIKKQLLQDLSTKNLPCEDCIKELLMSDHMLRVRSSQKKNRKRAQPEEPDQEEEDNKRARMAREEEDANDEEEPDEATS